jgi:hypothetical protein
VGARLAAAATLVLLFIPACTRPRLTLPTGQGTPLADFRSPLDEATKVCGSVNGFTGELQISGRVANQRVRGRALVGLAGGESMRLEGLAPFGAPAFILVATGGRATLLLPRDHRVLRDATPADVLEALSGASLSPGDLMSVLTGCGVRRRDAIGGSTLGDYVVIDLDGGARLYLKRQRDAWTVLAATWDTWRVEYDERAGAFPETVHLQSTAGATPVDLQVRVSGVETNAELSPEAFEVNVPSDTEPISLEELRQSGPLRDAASGAQP